MFRIVSIFPAVGSMLSRFFPTFSATHTAFARDFPRRTTTGQPSVLAAALITVAGIED
jgi:hypothetical protein